MSTVGEQYYVGEDEKRMLVSLIERLEEIREFPECYINEYCAALRKEIEEAAQRRPLIV